jgi:hypothetical protein
MHVQSREQAARDETERVRLAIGLRERHDAAIFAVVLMVYLTIKKLLELPASTGKPRDIVRVLMGNKDVLEGCPEGSIEFVDLVSAESEYDDAYHSFSAVSQSTENQEIVEASGRS